MPHWRAAPEESLTEPTTGRPGPRPVRSPGRAWQEEVAMPEAGALTTTPVGLALLAELAGLDVWDFMDQIGQPIAGTRLMATASFWPRSRRRQGQGQGPEHGQARAGRNRQAADV